MVKQTEKGKNKVQNLQRRVVFVMSLGFPATAQQNSSEEVMQGHRAVGWTGLEQGDELFLVGIVLIFVGLMIIWLLYVLWKSLRRKHVPRTISIEEMAALIGDGAIRDKPEAELVVPPTVPTEQDPLPQENNQSITSRLTSQGELTDIESQPVVEQVELDGFEVVGEFKILRSGKGKSTYIISGCIKGFEKCPDGSILIREAE